MAKFHLGIVPRLRFLAPVVLGCLVIKVEVERSHQPDFQAALDSLNLRFRVEVNLEVLLAVNRRPV